VTNSIDELVRRVRKLRDTGLDAVAKATLRVTSSEAYARVQGALSQPGLIVAGAVREAREKAMAQFLGQLNMPSRDEVLSLSQRLTHIETMLDDLSASFEEKRSAGKK